MRSVIVASVIMEAEGKSKQNFDERLQHVAMQVVVSCFEVKVTESDHRLYSSTLVVDQLQASLVHVLP
jgi:hypothetical protein